VQCGGAFERDPVAGKTVCGEPRPGVCFKLAEDRIDLPGSTAPTNTFRDLVK